MPAYASRLCWGLYCPLLLLFFPIFNFFPFPPLSSASDWRDISWKRLLFNNVHNLNDRTSSSFNPFFWQISSHFFDYSWRLWQSDVQTILHGFSALSQSYNSNAEDQHRELYLTCERWLLCSKIIRQLIISGFQSDSKCFQVILYLSLVFILSGDLYLEKFSTFLFFIFKINQFRS